MGNILVEMERMEVKKKTMKRKGCSKNCYSYSQLRLIRTKNMLIVLQYKKNRC